MSSFVFNMAGLRELMKSSGMQGSLSDAGKDVQNIANSSAYGYETHTYDAPFTAICTVYTGSTEAIFDNAENNTLLKAAQAAGLDMKSKG